MALRTAAQFLAGLRDTREVYYRGQRVPNVVDHPELGVAARHASIDYEMAENPKFRELAVHGEGSDEYSAYFRVPRNSQDLLSRSKLIEFVCGRIARFKAPREILFEELPKTSTGKIQKYVLRRRFEPGSGEEK